MVNIAQSVEKIIEDKPFVQEALRKGILNTAAYAEEIKPYVEGMLKKEVKFSAVNMAIRRLGTRLEKKQSVLAEFKSSTDMTVRNKLSVVTLYKQDFDPKLISRIYDVAEKDDFLTVTQGIKEVMMIVDDSLYARIKDKLDTRLKKKEIGGVCSITIDIPEDSPQAIGLFFQLTRQLAWENIPIIDLVSTYTEMTILVKDDQITKAFESIRRLVNK